MENVVSIFLPLAISLMLFSVGLGTTAADFRTVFKAPYDFFVGLSLQMIMVPLVGLFVVLLSLQLFPEQKEIALGVFILAICPGGASSNAFTLLSKGNVALSICLTSITSLLALVTMPLLIGMSSPYFFPQTENDFAGFTQIASTLFLATTVPLVLGIMIRYFFTKQALLIEKHIGPVVTVCLVFVILLSTWQNRSNVLASLLNFLPMASLFTTLTFLISFLAVKFIDISKQSRIALVYECGFQNGALCIFIALNIIKNEKVAMVAAMNTFPMYGIAFLFYLWAKRNSKVLSS